MKKINLLAFASLLVLAACGKGDIGDECIEDADCADGLECHVHEHDEEEHDEEEHGEEEEAGVCEEAGEHEDE